MGTRKIFTFGTTVKAELDKALKKIVNEGRPFSFVKEVRGPNEWYLIKIRFADVEIAERLWYDLNRGCDNAFSLGHRR